MRLRTAVIALLPLLAPLVMLVGSARASPRGVLSELFTEID